MMRNKASVGLVAHVRWFAATMRQPARMIYIAFVDGGPVGSGRLDFSDLGRVAECGVIVAPRRRGYGYGVRIVRLLADEALQCGAQKLIAVVRRSNFASIKCFQTAGFRKEPMRKHSQDRDHVDWEFWESVEFVTLVR